MICVISKHIHVHINYIIDYVFGMFSFSYGSYLGKWTSDQRFYGCCSISVEYEDLITERERLHVEAAKALSAGWDKAV